jgi:PHD-finger
MSMDFVDYCVIQRIMDVPRSLDADLSNGLTHQNGLDSMKARNTSKPMQNTKSTGTDNIDSLTVGDDDGKINRLGHTNESSSADASSYVSVKGIDSDKSNYRIGQNPVLHKILDQSSTSQSHSFENCNASVAGYDGHSCVQYVEQYCSESSQYKIVWARDDYIGEKVKVRRIRRAASKRRRTRNWIIDIDLSSCIQSTESNDLKRICPIVTSDSSSRVGNNYQARVEKMPIHKSLLDSRCSTSFAVPCLIWNPQLALEAERSGEDIEGFLSKSDNLNVKILLMEALNEGQYNVRLATEIFVAHYLKKPKFLLDYGNADEFAKTFTTEQFAKTKDFDFVASRLNCSKEIALINYYRWKRSNPNRPEHYVQMKHERHKESDVCEVCDNGGALIVCDLCNKAYHCYCLSPPLTIIPNGDWFCPECETRSPAKLRRHMGYHKISSASPQDKSSRAFPPLEGDACLNSAPPERFESLKFIHKELFGGLEKPPMRPQLSLPPAFHCKVKQATYSPENMTWDSTRGFWIDNETLLSDTASQEIKQNEVSNGKNSELTTCSSSNHDDDIDPIDRHGHEPRRKDSPVQSIGSSTAADAPVLLRGQTYEVRIPVTPEGLLIYIENRSGRFTSFSGYRQTSTGEIGFAQRTGAFMANGDFILEVDNVSCFKKSFAEVRSLLKGSKPGATMRILKMFHPLDVSKHVMS